MDELSTLLNDLEQLYYENVQHQQQQTGQQASRTRARASMYAQRPTQAVSPAAARNASNVVAPPSPRAHRASMELPPRPKVNPYAHLQQAGQSSPQQRPQHAQVLQAPVGQRQPAVQGQTQTQQRPTVQHQHSSPGLIQQQHQMVEQRRRREEEAEKRDKEELIRQQQALIEEQNRQIEELKRLQFHQQQQMEEEEEQGNPLIKSTEVQLDDIMNDLTQIICAADDSALPDTILNDLHNMELRSTVAQPPSPQRQMHTQPLPVVPGVTAAPPRARPVSAYRAAASVVAPLPRQAVQQSGYRSPVQASGVGMAHTVAVRPAASSPASVQELQQRFNSRPQQMPATTIPSVPAPQTVETRGNNASSSSSAAATSGARGPVPFSARRPTLSAARSRAPLPAMYTSVQNGQYDKPPTKLPLVPRAATERDGPALSLTMGLVDGSTKKIVVASNFTIHDVLVAFASKLGLWQIDFFSLAEVRPGNADRWLHPAVQVGRYNVPETSKLVLKIKYFKKPRYLVDSVAWRLFYLQIQSNVVAGAYPCTERLAITLAAHQLQIQEGDHQPQKHKPGWFGGVDNLQKFVPPEVTLKYPMVYIEERIFRLHAKLVGKNDHDVLFREYIELAAAIPTFGINLYNVIDGEFEKGGVKRRLGIGEDGIMLTRRAEKTVYDFYPWTSMGGWLKASDTMFQVKVVGQPVLMFQASADCVYDILELMTGYYLIAFHSDPSVPDFPIPYEPDCLPHPRLFLPYKPRILQNVYTKSSLEVLKDTYEAVCKEYTVRPIEAFMLQMDETLDHNTGVLNKISLSDCDMGEFQFMALLKGLEAAANQAAHAHNNVLIHEIDLSANQNSITVRHAHFVAQLIKACPTLRILKLNDCRLGAQGAVDIAAVLTSNLTLHELHIAANQIHDRGMAALVKALKGNQGLHTFNFGDNGLSPDGAKLLGDMLEKNPHITNLSLGMNKFGDVGINHIYHGIKCNTTLSRINLSRTEFTAKAGKHLLRVLTEKPNITAVRLSHNDIGQSGGQILGAYLTVGSRLSVLDISDTNVGSKALKAIGRGLKENRSITVLKLSNNEFDKKSAGALAEALEVNRTLQSLVLVQCCFPKAALVVVANALRSRNTTLQRLNLSYNPMSFDVAKAIGDMLAYNTSLRVLKMAGCLSSDGAKEVITGIGVNRALLNLSLSGCKMNKAVWTNLADAVLQNRTLERLVCKDTACDVRLFEEVLSHWDLRKHLLHVKVLHLGGNNIVPTDRLRERIRNYPITILFS